MSLDFAHNNLVPGQWQIGNLIMGFGTNIIIEDVDVKPYDINAQDYQVDRSNETRFGQDYFKPSTVELTVDVLHNKMLPMFEDSNPDFWADMPTVDDLAVEWRADDVRSQWGVMKPLLVCSKLDGIPKVIWGRPGQFSPTFTDEINNGEIVKCVMEYRRGDTLAWSIDETTKVGTGTITRSVGSALPSWVRILIGGPSTNPVVTIGDIEIGITGTVASGKTLEISSYPWERRLVDSDGNNRSDWFTGGILYLDKVMLPFGSTTIGLSGGGSITTSWRDAYAVI